MPQKVWHQCLEVLRDEFPAQQFNTWLRPLQPELNDGQLVLFAPNRFVMDWVNQKYLRRIEEVIKDLEGGQAPRINMRVGSASVASNGVIRSEELRVTRQAASRRRND
ncbi:DnaA N-terminal domain-containing protein, partial [uncultured Marinobacter sp.]|uniref:DnaA N-terminal domain-containing protein n=1 Tax=uncultured Marinobacter sp. TaxID=187379 RepID=UPI0030DAEF57